MLKTVATIVENDQDKHPRQVPDEVTCAEIVKTAASACILPSCPFEGACLNGHRVQLQAGRRCSILIEQCLNGIQLGMLLFLLAAGLTLIFGIMDLVNLAHGSLYMIGAYFAATFAA